MVLAGIECSPKIRDFRANGIPVGERIDFFRHAQSSVLTGLFGFVLDILQIYKKKKEEPRLKSEVLAGDPSGIRTPDTLIKSSENQIPVVFIKNPLRLNKPFNYAALKYTFNILSSNRS